MKKSIPEKIDLTTEEADKLVERVYANCLSANDKKILSGIVHFCLWLQVKLTEAKITIRRLRKIFDVRSEKRSQHSSSEQEESMVQGSSMTCNAGLDEARKDRERKPGKNKGHLPASYYQGASKVELKHASLSSGDPCPAPLCRGRVYNISPGNIIRILGGRIAEAKHYVVEKLRCNLCATLFSPELPAGVGKEKYDARFKATLVVYKYFLGLPFHRIEKMQSYLGVPLPDSTQWQLVEQVANGVYRVFYYMEYLAAQGRAMFLDDTGAIIIAVTLEAKDNPTLKRTGAFTTAILSETEGQKIYLFYSGKKHAGENATAILKNRCKTLDQIQYMCDGLLRNIPKGLAVILINCLSHARREFIDVEPYFPEECGFVIKSLASVYKYDKEAKEQQLSNEERLKYHQQYSKPIMGQLKRWAEAQVQGLTEPNSGLGRAINYMLKRWDKLTRFLEIAGAALDNNCIEEVLKIPIRVRKNAYFFATEHGAFVGGMLTSLVVTAARAGANPVEYLTALQQYKTQVFKAPQDWLPWNYEKTLFKLQARASPAAA